MGRTRRIKKFGKWLEEQDQIWTAAGHLRRMSEAYQAMDATKDKDAWTERKNEADEAKTALSDLYQRYRLEPDSMDAPLDVALQDLAFYIANMTAKKVFSFRADPGSVTMWRQWIRASGETVDYVGASAMAEYMANHPLPEAGQALFDAWREKQKKQ